MSDISDTSHGARLLAIETAIRVLIDQASVADPTIRDRIKESADAYLATVPMLSELEARFINISKEFVDVIVCPPR